MFVLKIELVIYTYPLLDGNLKPVSSLITILAIVSALAFPATQKNYDDRFMYTY